MVLLGVVALSHAIALTIQRKADKKASALDLASGYLLASFAFVLAISCLLHTESWEFAFATILAGVLLVAHFSCMFAKWRQHRKSRPDMNS